MHMIDSTNLEIVVVERDLTLWSSGSKSFSGDEMLEHFLFVFKCNCMQLNRYCVVKMEIFQGFLVHVTFLDGICD